MQHVDPSAEWNDPAYSQVPADDSWRTSRLWAAAYLAVTVAVSAVYLWSIAVPGMRFLAWLPSVFGLLGVTVVWCVLAIVTVARWRRGTLRRTPRVLFAVPLIGLVVVAARVTEAPLRLRFELARDEMTAVAEAVLADPAEDPTVPESIGGIDVLGASRVPGGVVLYDTDGFFLDNAGYAYLADGDTVAAGRGMERPTFRPLGGGWYAFTASW